MQNKELLIYREEDSLCTALLREGVLVEFSSFTDLEGEKTLTVGEIKLGVIREVSRSIRAAFVDIGATKNAFLPLDDRDLSGYVPGMELAVQIKRLPEGEKGAQITDRWTIAGQYLVISYGNPVLGVSGKIYDEAERLRLKKTTEKLPGRPLYGYIARTESQGIAEDILMKEGAILYQKAQEILQKAVYSRIGAVLYGAGIPSLQLLKRLKSQEIGAIRVDGSIPREERDRLIYEIEMEYPKFLSLVEVADIHDGFSMGQRFRIPSQLKRSKEERIYLPSGGYIVIQKTEALTVIDVNSGKMSSGKDKEQTVYLVNGEATAEIATQLQLRNLTGMILIDYINMKKEAHKNELLAYLKKRCLEDTHTVSVLGYTRLGLMELTRH